MLGMSIDESAFMRESAASVRHFKVRADRSCGYVVSASLGVTATDMGGAKCLTRELRPVTVCEVGTMPAGRYFTVGM